MTNASFWEARTPPPAGSWVREKSRFFRYSASFVSGPSVSFADLGDRAEVVLFFALAVFLAMDLCLKETCRERTAPSAPAAASRDLPASSHVPARCPSGN